MKSRRSNQEGFALLIVMWVLVILTVLVIGFARRASLERQMAWYALDQEQSQQVARGAVIRAVQELANRDALDEFHGQKGYSGFDQTWADFRDLRSEKGMYQYLHSSDFQDDRCTVYIEDCESRFSVNHAKREIFDEVEFLDFKQVRLIFDRLDTDGGRRLPHRFPGLADFRESLEIPEDLWEGDDDEPGAKDLFTIWGDQAGMININTASPATLLLIPELEERAVNDLIAFRNGPDGIMRTRDDRSFSSIKEAGQLLNLDSTALAALNTYGKTDSIYFTIRAHATRRRGKVNGFCTAVVLYAGGTPQILYWYEGSNGA